MNTRDNVLGKRRQLGIRIRKLRQERRLSQEQLAVAVGCDRSYISRIERGECCVSTDTVFMLASGLEISPSQLFEGITAPNAQPDDPASAGRMRGGPSMARCDLTHF